MKAPQAFFEVYGQDKAVEILKKVAASHTLPIRALSLVGPTGTGKTSLMRIFAKALNCATFQLEYKDLHVRDVCNTCLNCMDNTLYFEEDALTLQSTEGTTQFLLKLINTPTRLKRLVVFEEAQMAPEASINILLRAVNEGIPNTIIAFTSTKFLPSILQSRCLTIKLPALTNEMIAWRIETEASERGIDIHPYHITLLAGLAQGQLRKASRLLDAYKEGGLEGTGTPYLLLVEFIVNTAKRQSNEEMIRVLMTYTTEDIMNSLKLIITNSYKGLSITETAMNNAGITDKVYNFIYDPVNVQATTSREGVEAFLYNLNKFLLL